MDSEEEMPDSEVLLPSVAKPAVVGSKRRRVKRKGNPATGSKMGSGSTATSTSSDKVRITESTAATAVMTAVTTSNSTTSAATVSHVSSKKQSRKNSTSRQEAQKETKGGQASVALTPSTAVVSTGGESRPSSTTSLDTSTVTPPPPLPPQLHPHPSLLVKETHASFNEPVVSEYSLTPSLLDEVLSQKKLRLLRSPDVVKFFKQRQQQTLLANSRSIRGLGQLSVTTTTNVADRTHFKN
ncbi:Hypothetical predicted protein [Octopus vulgaris]|uniref:Regulatory factor X-associated protein RFXANK-binding domain-containing protein n=1 Tax=Octopus vulgaris TaxID=6645 RepID=A0AA36C1L5_OCTVU|nr:Hypothetical predicted protein [Octopus vulgaris]